MKVVTAGIIERDGRFLIAKRPHGKRLAGLWEFPGGKLEAGETPEEGLARELYEELGFAADVREILDARIETEFSEHIILYYAVKIASGEPRALEHEEIRYVAPEALTQYAFSSGDAPVAAALGRKERQFGRAFGQPGANP